MSNETIMLAATFNPDKAVFPKMISEKIDGVAADFYTTVRLGGTRWNVRSRDDKPILSVQHILEFLNDTVQPVKGLHIISELHISGRDFKDISGISRRKEADDETELLRANIYDLYTEGKENTDYVDRYDSILEHVPDLGAMLRRIPSYLCNTREEFDKQYMKIVKQNNSKRPSGCEGIIARSPRGEDSWYRVAKRPAGFAKLKKVETVDIPFNGYEEAIDKKTKKKMGMVGRIISEHNGVVIGAGPGKMPHAERIRVHKEWPKDKGNIFEAKHMPDDSYQALREPRFLHWRPDKD